MVLVTDDEDTRGCLDDIVGDGLELIDPHDSPDLGESRSSKRNLPREIRSIAAIA